MGDGKGEAMNLYRVYTEDDWQVLVVHHLARLAKKMAAREWPTYEVPWWTDYKVRLVRHVAVPVTETTPRVIMSCEEAAWTCPAWGHEECDCETAEGERSEEDGN